MNTQMREIIAALTDARVGAADLHESQGRTGALPNRIKPIIPEWTLAGPALPVSFGAVDNLWLHRALTVAEPGQVIVAKPEGPEEAGYWGEIMTEAALVRGVRGLVLDGCVRDRTRLVSLGMPVFSTGLSIIGTNKLSDGAGTIGDPIEIGGVPIEMGDLVFGDEDGVVVIPNGRAEEVVEAAVIRKRDEREIVWKIRSGQNTLEIYGLPGLTDTARL